jgi:hypothetical protein
MYCLLPCEKQLSRDAPNSTEQALVQLMQPGGQQAGQCSNLDTGHCVHIAETASLTLAEGLGSIENLYFIISSITWSLTLEFANVTVA